MYCRLHMCSPVLRHITYSTSYKIVFLAYTKALQHIQKLLLSDYENKVQDAINTTILTRQKKYCSKQQMLNLSSAEEKLRGQSTCVLHISSLGFYYRMQTQSVIFSRSQPAQYCIAHFIYHPKFLRLRITRKYNWRSLQNITPLFFGPSTFCSHHSLCNEHNRSHNPPGRLFINQRF